MVAADNIAEQPDRLVLFLRRVSRVDLEGTGVRSSGGRGVEAVHCRGLQRGGVPRGQRHTLELQQLVQCWGVCGHPPRG